MQSLAVVGAGEMGHGIAELAAVSGFEVRLIDRDPDVLKENYQKIAWSLEKLKDNGDIQEDPDAVMDRVTTTTELEEGVDGVDAVIEAVPEDLELKQGLFASIEAAAPSDTIMATNTSGIPITDIARGVESPSRVIGMHFFNPVMLMDLIEIVRGEETSDETTKRAEQLAEAFGRQHVVVRKDVPGFVTSRTILPYMLEAAWQLHEGAANMEEIDAAGKFDAGFPMGPFELADQTGIDVPVKGVDKGAFKEKYFEIAPNQRQKVDDGDLGKKTGRGWHDWDDGDGCTASPEQVGAFDPLVLVAPTVNEAARLIEWDVADAEAIDLALRLGTAYPKGPCRLGDELGLDGVVASLEDNPRHEPVELLQEMVGEGKTGVDAGEGFYEYDTGSDATTYYTIDVSHDKNSHITTITLDRPERRNSLNAEMFGELDAAFDRALDRETRCIVIRGNGTFCAGADISMIADLEQYEFLTTPMGEVFSRLEELPVPSIAAIDGNCFGGGLELALACDFRIASENSSLGTTEINLGLLPGGGGTQRLPRLIGLAKAKELVMLGRQLSAAEAGDCGLVTDVVSNESFEDALASMSSELAESAPIAQHAAKLALHDGTDASFDSGLTLEKALVAILLETDDLMEGIKAFYGNRDPEFRGA